MSDALITRMGSYRHYKGGTFTLLYIAENSNQRDQQMAVYVSHLRRKVLVRPWSDWTEQVVWPDGVTRDRYVLMREDEAD